MWYIYIYIYIYIYTLKQETVIDKKKSWRYKFQIVNIVINNFYVNNTKILFRIRLFWLFCILFLSSSFSTIIIVLKMSQTFETQFRIASVCFAWYVRLYCSPRLDGAFIERKIWLKCRSYMAVSCFINFLRVSLRANAHFWYRVNLCSFRKNKKHKSKIHTILPKTDWEINPMYYVSRIVLHSYSLRQCVLYTHLTYNISIQKSINCL